MTDRIGFIGLGRMGSAMVKRLCQTGAPPTIWNRDRAKAAPLEAFGCSVAQTPRDLAAASDVILVCVHDAAAVGSVLFGQLHITSPQSVPQAFTDAAAAAMFVSTVLAVVAFLLVFVLPRKVDSGHGAPPPVE